MRQANEIKGPGCLLFLIIGIIIIPLLAIIIDILINNYTPLKVEIDFARMNNIASFFSNLLTPILAGLGTILIWNTLRSQNSANAVNLIIDDFDKITKDFMTSREKYLAKDNKYGLEELETDLSRIILIYHIKFLEWKKFARKNRASWFLFMPEINFYKNVFGFLTSSTDLVIKYDNRYKANPKLEFEHAILFDAINSFLQIERR